jgi:hypothetical protein
MSSLISTTRSLDQFLYIDLIVLKVPITFQKWGQQRESLPTKEEAIPPDYHFPGRTLLLSCSTKTQLVPAYPRAGAIDGASEDRFDGKSDGIVDGISDGISDGNSDGISDGMSEGTSEPTTCERRMRAA